MPWTYCSARVGSSRSDPSEEELEDNHPEPELLESDESDDILPSFIFPPKSGAASHLYNQINQEGLLESICGLLSVVDFTDLAVTLRRKTSRNQVEIYVEIGLKTLLAPSDQEHRPQAQSASAPIAEPTTYYPNVDATSLYTAGGLSTSASGAGTEYLVRQQCGVQHQRTLLGNLIRPNGEQLTSTDPYNTTVFVGDH
ncbi:hypothetical protein B0H13DRAFT_1850692 [Mycena leptocephala]|nr:hypothetical protein B0H13DRAFT_1850692 [Mycena leptocephala]